MCLTLNFSRQTCLLLPKNSGGKPPTFTRDSSKMMLTHETRRGEITTNTRAALCMRMRVDVGVDKRSARCAREFISVRVYAMYWCCVFRVVRVGFHWLNYGVWCVCVYMFFVCSYAVEMSLSISHSLASDRVYLGGKGGRQNSKQILNYTVSTQNNAFSYHYISGALLLRSGAYYA